MKIELGYIDLECNLLTKPYKTDRFDFEIVEVSEKGVYIYVADPRINDSFWIDANEIIVTSDEIRAGYKDYKNHKERQEYLKTRTYRQEK